MHLLQRHLLETADAHVMLGQKISDGLLRASGKYQNGTRIQFPGRHHGGQSIEVCIEVSRDEIHAGILAGSRESIQA